MALLEVTDLEVALINASGTLPIVRGVSFTVEENQTFGIVGESGSGKSITSLAIMGLLHDTTIQVTGGSIKFEGRELTMMSPKERRAVMGNQMAMIFQEPMTSLNPVYRVGEQIVETLRQHNHMTNKQARERAVELLELVRIPEPERRVDSFPHQMSGGQRQRVMIAMALACDPKLLIADEPTTALDVTVQKEVLELMGDLQSRMGTAIIMVSHDLGVIAETCDMVAVMYYGEIIESAPSAELFSNTSHPYTRGLLNSIPIVDHDVEWLEAIPGRVPTINESLAGCAFSPRCPISKTKCERENPLTKEVASAHTVRCHFAEKEQA